MPHGRGLADSSLLFSLRGQDICAFCDHVHDPIFHGLTVPKNCSVGELSTFMEDFIYWGSQVQEGVPFGHARQRLLDALVHHDGVIDKLYNEQNKSGRLEFTYLTLYLLYQVKLRQKDAFMRHQDHQKWRLLPLDKRPNLVSLNFMGAEPVGEQVNPVGESKTPPSNDAQVFEPPDELDERFVNAVGQLVPKKGPKCPFSGFAGHTEDKRWKKHPHYRKPLILKSGKPKSGTGPGNRLPKGKGLPEECSHCKKEGHTVDQCWDKHSYLKAEWEAKRVGKGTKS